jgi:hypothetical protein
MSTCLFVMRHNLICYRVPRKTKGEGES